jgi:hypothetical protein
MKPEMIEGQEAKGNFERTMKKLFRVSKTEIKEAEKKSKTSRKRKIRYRSAEKTAQV